VGRDGHGRIVRSTQRDERSKTKTTCHVHKKEQQNPAEEQMEKPDIVMLQTNLSKVHLE